MKALNPTSGNEGCMPTLCKERPAEAVKTLARLLARQAAHEILFDSRITSKGKNDVPKE